jgi:hypothetical protein
MFAPSSDGRSCTKANGPRPHRFVYVSLDSFTSLMKGRVFTAIHVGLSCAVPAAPCIVLVSPLQAVSGIWWPLQPVILPADFSSDSLQFWLPTANSALFIMLICGKEQSSAVFSSWSFPETSRRLMFGTIVACLHIHSHFSGANQNFFI